MIGVNVSAVVNGTVFVRTVVVAPLHPHDALVVGVHLPRCRRGRRNRWICSDPSENKQNHHSETRNQNVRTVTVVVVNVHERDPNNAPKASLVFNATNSTTTWLVSNKK
jgi:hypothetical protein